MPQEIIPFTLYSLFVFYVAFAVFGLMGQLLRLLYPQIGRSNFSIFLFGMMVVIISGACFYTGFKTSMLFFLLFFLVIYVSNRNSKEVPQFLKTNIGYSTLFFLPLIVYGLTWLKSISIFSFPFFNTGRDHVFYSNVSQFISKSGIESINIDWINNLELIGVTPYHYVELWMNTIIANASGILHVHIFDFITIPLLFSLLLLSFYAFAKQYIGHWQAIVIALAVVYLPDFSYWLIGAKPYLISLPKHVPFVIVLLFQLFFIKRKQYVWVLGLFGLYIAINLTLLPASLVGFMVLSSALVFLRRINLKRVMVLLGYYIGFVLLMVLFYRVFQGEIKFSSGLDFEYLISYYKEDFSHTRKAIHFFVKYISWPFVDYYWVWGIAFLAGIFIKRIRNSMFSILFFGFILTAILGIGSSLIHPYSESSQLVYNFLIPFSSIIGLVVFVEIMKYISEFKFQVVYGVLLLFLSGSYLLICHPFPPLNGVLSGYSIEFLNEVKTITKNKNNKNVLRSIQKNDITYAYDLYNNVQPWGCYLYFLDDGWAIYTINHSEIDRSEIVGMPAQQFQLSIQNNWYDYMVLNRNVNSQEISDSFEWSIVRNSQAEIFNYNKTPLP